MRRAQREGRWEDARHDANLAMAEYLGAQVDILRSIVLRCVAVCCGVLQCVAGCKTRCQLGNGRVFGRTGRHFQKYCVAVCCSVLQCAAVCCSVLQCVAVCCNVLQDARHDANLAIAEYLGSQVDIFKDFQKISQKDSQKDSQKNPQKVSQKDSQKDSQKVSPPLNWQYN